MEHQSDFRVVIAGGGITGLALANMLQLYGIDFVLLEASPDVAPPVGVGSSLLPHGNRILDQLGLYNKLLALGTPVDSLHFRDQSGEVIRQVRGVNQSMLERHGYSILSMDLRVVLQALYDSIQDKTKILTNKEVQKVDTTHNGITVRTSDGSSYQGDILVGADGSQSTIRDKMWQIADEMSPGWIASDEHIGPTCEFGCVSGVSDPCQGIEPGSNTSVFGNNESYHVNSGPNGRLYWSHFFKMARRGSGDRIPTFTKEDEKAILDARANARITPSVNFRQLLDNKVSSTLVPLQEYVFRQWYFQRIITLGDAAHKILPITGHNESACIESAATLANALGNALARSPNTKPSLEQIEHSFATTQKKRHARLTNLKEYAHEQQRTEFLDTPLHNIAALYFLPMIDAENITYELSRSISLAEKLNNPKPSLKARLIPYKDELPRAPKAHGLCKWYFAVAYLLIAGLCYHGMWVQPGYYGLWDHLDTILRTGEFPYNSGFPLKRTYIGNQFIDNIFTYLSAVFMSGLKDWDPSFRFMNLYFLGILVQPIAIWTVEAYRKRNLLTPLSMVTIWYTLFQFTGIGIFMPLYYAVYSFISEPESYWWPINREVPIQYADSMIWAVMAGYALPTVALFVPWEDPYTLQNIESFWQISPMLVPLFCTILSRFHSSQRTKAAHQPRKANETFPDLEPLKRLYVMTGILGALFHVYCVIKVIYDPELTLLSVFWPDFATQEKTLGEGVKFMFLIDVWALEAATYIWSCQAVWDLKRVGRTNADISKAVALITGGTVVLGPGATLCAVWYWRETRLAKTSLVTRLSR